MLYFVRRHQFFFGALLAMVFAFFSTGCSPYRYSTASPAKAIDAIQFFVLDEKFPEDFAWRVDLQALRQSGLEGKISRLSKDDAEKIVNGSPQSLTNPQSLHLVALYLKNDYAQTLSDSTSIHLSFDQVVRTEAYEFSPEKAKSNSFWLGVLTGPIIFTVILAIACSCPSIYAENPDGVVFEGDIFAGATHPQLERHDWLPLSQLKPNDDVYRLRMLNEDPEIQHTNFLELIAVDHPVGTLVGYDKYGRLLALGEPQSPIIATDLEGQDLRFSVLKEDNDRFLGNPNATNPRAEDGLLLTFKRPPGAQQAKLIIRANTSEWLAFSHHSLQQDLGKYGPKVRQKFLEKDSAALQQWILEQNMPLSVWLETAPEKWEKADFFNLVGPKSPRRNVLQLDLSKLTGNQVRIKLATGFKFWEIDFVAMDFSAAPPVQTRTLPLASAIDQSGKDVKEMLRADDGQYCVQPKIGDEVALTFPAPPVPANVERSLFLHAKGHYQILHEPAAGRPSRRFLKQFTQPDAFPKYSRDRWNEFSKQDTIWVASLNR